MGTLVPFRDTVKLLGVTLDSALHGPARHRGCLQLQLSHTGTAGHPTVTDARCCQDAGTQHVISRLDYANALLSGTTSGNLDTLQVAQNSLARVVCQASRSASATELRRQLHWLSIRQRIAYKLAVITYYRTRSTGIPVYLTDLIKNYHPSRTLRSADKLILSVSRMTLALSAKAFNVNAPSVWNSVSYSCRSAESFSSFWRALKTELFDTVYCERKHSV